MSSPLTLAGLLAAVLALWATTGSAMVCRAGAALSRTPRLAVAFLLVTGLSWVVGLVTLGLVLAWSAAGPALLPGRAAEVCQRCLEATNPFGTAGAAPISPAVPLLLAAGAGSVVLLRSLARAVSRWRATGDQVRFHLRDHVVVDLRGHRVRLLDDPRPRAFSLPSRHGGIAVSTGAVALLAPRELAAVLAHEAAHLRQRHHLLLAAAHAVLGPLHWIPLHRAILGALPLYVEIAADDDARRRHGTDTLASALLTLGGAVDKGLEPPAVGALHACGPDRVRHLVAPSPARQGLAALGIGVGVLVTAAAVSTGVLGLYSTAVVTGCVL